MSAMIRNKKREPVRIVTPELHEAEGRPLLAADLRSRNIEREEEYIVGRHAYVVTYFTNGKVTVPHRIF